MSSESTLSSNTKVALGLVVTLLAAATSFGVMYQRMNNLDDRVNHISTMLVEQNKATSGETERIVRLETQYSQIITTLAEIKQALAPRTR